MHPSVYTVAKYPDVFVNYGDILANSIIVNEANTKATDRSRIEYVAIGMAINAKGRPVFVRTVIDNQNGVGNINSVNVVYAAEARKGSSAVGFLTGGLPENGQSLATSQGRTNPNYGSQKTTEISVADFLELGKGVFKDAFSKDVNAVLNVGRDNTKLGNTLVYSMSSYDKLAVSEQPKATKEPLKQALVQKNDLTNDVDQGGGYTAPDG